jgi:superfamily II DNA or RNA helicase
MEITLRPHQEVAFNAVIESPLLRLLLVADTGWGKTETALKLIQYWTEKGRSVTFLAHRCGLVANASARCDRYGIDHFVLDAKTPKDIPPPSCLFRIVSVQTLMSRSLFYDWMLDDILILDEAHETTYFNYIKDNWEKPKLVLGMTATPWRLKKTESLDDFYEDLVPTMLPRELIAQGWRVPFVYFSNPNIKLDTLEYGNTATGYKSKSVSVTVDNEEAIEATIANWLRLAKGRKTLAFCCDVKHTRNLCNAFNAAGIPADYIIGSTPSGVEKDAPLYPESREGIIEALEEGTIDVICSCDTMKAGIDIPCVSAILDVSPSMSKAGVYQSHGRGSRLFEGKTECLILDMVGNILRHGMVHDYTWTDYQLRPARSKGDGQAPVRVCPDCYHVCHPTKLVCPNCGYVFPPPERQIATGDLVLRYGSYTPSEWKPSTDRDVSFYHRLKRSAFLGGFDPKKAVLDFKKEKGYYPQTSEPHWDLGAVFSGHCNDIQKTQYLRYLRKVAAKKKKSSTWIESEFIKEFGTIVAMEFFSEAKESFIWEKVLANIEPTYQTLLGNTAVLVSFDGKVAIVGASNPVFKNVIREPKRVKAIEDGFQKTIDYPVRVEFTENYVKAN